MMRCTRFLMICLATIIGGYGMAAAAPTVIDLTQTGCQFLEPEGKDQNVPYELGFYLRGAGPGRLTLPKVSGGGLTTGKTQDYQIDLKPGSDVYPCPLNPTPDYPLVVKP